MTRADLLALAERCEAATGPDRELDAQIHCAVKGWQFSHWGGEFFGTTPAGERFTVGLPARSASDTATTHHKMRTDSLAPAYTVSLDAAMTLVPEGALFDVGHFGDDKPGVFLSSVMPERGKTQSAEAATPSLALAAASLRAMASDPSQTQGDIPNV
jgi:hypothetical protein